MEYNIPEILIKRYTWMKEHSAFENGNTFAIEIIADDRLGLLADIGSLGQKLGINYSYFQSWAEYNGTIHTLVQAEQEDLKLELISQLAKLESVRTVYDRPTYKSTYGKRVIIMGGGAQVAQVATGAITEADRHNIRGEAISVDTIAKVGEKELAQTITAVGRLHRASILVLAGALMGGEISEAVTELRENYGIPVMGLNMAGSITKVMDLVVTDPVQAGVMSVMLISKIAKFNLLKLNNRFY